MVSINGGMVCIELMGEIACFVMEYGGVIV